MTKTTLGFREDFKEEEPEKEKEREDKEKEKDDKVEDFSDLETKEKEREKEKVTLQETRVIGLKMNGREMKQRIGMKAIGPMKMKQRGNPKHGMNGKKIIMMSMDTSKEKERKESKEKEKERKVMDLKIKEKDKVMGKEKQTMWTHQSSSQQAALPLSSNASRFFVTHSSMYLTSVKMMEDEDQQKKPDSSGCAFLGQEPDSCYEGSIGRHGFPYGESDATHSGNPRSWLYKSYGLQECYHCFLWIRGQARLWTMV